ncbi:MAG: ATP-binding cassette domain-containing protein [Lachnospiraceae bacterium]|nr:ATP-binding cassette domain-containing protein [Lachnospiraceae bacterium]
MSIILKDVSVKFRNGNVAVNHVNLEIPQGIYGLLGENGAGKTTLMRVLTTILKPTTGTVTIDGVVYEEKHYQEIQKKIGYLPQELNLYPNLTVRESLLYMGELSGVPAKLCRDRVDFYLEKTSLKEHQKKKNRQLSGGMKRRVGLIQALLTEPDFLIVDEPTTGLDPEERIRIRNLLVDFSVGRTILFSTHVVEDLAATCSQLSIMKKGSFLYSGFVKEILEEAKGHIWICHVKNEEEARVLEREYCVSSKQYDRNGMQVKIISEQKPNMDCFASTVSLEDAYMYLQSFQGTESSQ